MDISFPPNNIIPKSKSIDDITIAKKALENWYWEKSTSKCMSSWIEKTTEIIKTGGNYE